MSMTEIEALNALKLEGGLQIDGKVKRVAQFFEGLSVAIQALSEIQQYRAIGTVEEFKAFKLGRLGNKGFITIGQTIEEFKEEIRNKAIDEFAKSLKTDYVNFDLYYILENNNIAFENTSLIIYQDMIDELAEQMKGDAEC